MGFLIIILIFVTLGKIIKTITVTDKNEEIQEKKLETIKVENTKERQEYRYEVLKNEVLDELGLNDSDIFSCFDTVIIVKSRQSLENYDSIKFFKENKEIIEEVERILENKKNRANILKKFLEGNRYTISSQYNQLVEEINKIINRAEEYIIEVSYISSSGNDLGSKKVTITQQQIEQYKKDPSLLMTKSEYNKLIKEEEKRILNQKQKEYYDIVNKIIDYANTNKDSLIIKESRKKLDDLIGKLFDKTVNSIKKIKSIDSEEWILIENFMLNLKKDIEEIIEKNKQIFEYYESEDFFKIKKTCEELMNSQKEFNEYIDEKVQSISKLFGTRVIRNETVVEDEYNYIRPYKKTITPFTAEVSSNVFASAENNSLDYIIKYFYPNKKQYPEQIEKLSQLIEELETLREAKQIIENYKKEYKQYLNDVPDYVMKNDEAGFYSRLGFATIDESVLTVEYKFVYTSNGGMVQRYFTVPMKEETIVELIKALENKLTTSAFVKEQRTLMTKKLREYIKERDNYTCCNCGNSTHNEPNLLLEIDHIIPVSKGGETIENNLQTLCWKCNRAKSNKIS